MTAKKFLCFVFQVLLVFCVSCAEITDTQPQTATTPETGQDMQMQQRRSKMPSGNSGSGTIGNMPEGAGPDMSRMQEMRNRMFGGGFASEKTQGSSKTATTPGKADEPGRLLQHGKELLEAKRYQQAAFEFETFLSKYEYHDLTPEALYYIGECYYKQEKYLDAIKVCKKIEQLYHGYPLTPNAIYRIAKCYEKLGQPKASQETLNRLKANFPQFDPATIKEY